LDLFDVQKFPGPDGTVCSINDTARCGHARYPAAGGPFDFVFIDAGHSTKAVMRDAEGVLPHVQDGAYLLFHDSFRGEITAAIDRFTWAHLGSVVDFGTLTREFHSTAHPGDEVDGGRYSCGMRGLRGIRQALRRGVGARG
jgi:hypothetical protein